MLLSLIMDGITSLDRRRFLGIATTSLFSGLGLASNVEAGNKKSGRKCPPAATFQPCTIYQAKPIENPTVLNELTKVEQLISSLIQLRKDDARFAFAEGTDHLDWILAEENIKFLRNTGKPAYIKLTQDSLSTGTKEESLNNAYALADARLAKANSALETEMKDFVSLAEAIQKTPKGGKLNIPLVEFKWINDNREWLGTYGNAKFKILVDIHEQAPDNEKFYALGIEKKREFLKTLFAARLEWSGVAENLLRAIKARAIEYEALRAKSQKQPSTETAMSMNADSLIKQEIARRTTFAGIEQVIA